MADAMRLAEGWACHFSGNTMAAAKAARMTIVLTWEMLPDVTRHRIPSVARRLMRMR
jgi:hypothetical protein